jgi:hypothetical protein
MIRKGFYPVEIDAKDLRQSGEETLQSPKKAMVLLSTIRFFFRPDSELEPSVAELQKAKPLIEGIPLLPD